MSKALPEIRCDLMIVGTGLTGMAAALFAAKAGVDTVQVGLTSELNYASGLLDLMGIHPVAEQRAWTSPWAAVEQLVRDEPAHPYALLTETEMRSALTGFLDFLKRSGLPYWTDGDRNVQVITPAGTLKSTYAVPSTLVNGIRSFAAQRPCRIIDIEGLKGFSARQIVTSLGAHWPRLKAGRIAFPDALPGEQYPEHMARYLEIPAARARLADVIRAALGPDEDVGLPAILGLYNTMAVFEDLQQRIERPLFEIPIMPPAVAGLRLKHVFEQNLGGPKLRCLQANEVFSATMKTGQDFRFEVGRQGRESVVRARAAILATGRFFGKGLRADRQCVRETLFDLPVAQPDDRRHWHRGDLLDPRGHAVNRAGLATDRHLRPLDAAGRAAHPLLFAAGSILAHQDWARMKCGAGLAVTTAYSAVQRCRELIAIVK